MARRKRRCLGCTERYMGCQIECPYYKEDDEAHQREKQAIWDAKHHPSDLYLKDNAAKSYEANRKWQKEKKQRIGNSGGHY